MDARDWLSTWIQPQHLDEDALGRYRGSFGSHPARLVWIPDFLQPAVAERLSRFLASEADFHTEYGLYSVEGAVTEDRWMSADAEDRFFRYGKLSGTAQGFQVSRNALTYVQFRQAFQRPELKMFFEALSGLPLAWSDDFGSHAMRAGDFLRAHSDDNRNRQLALIVYLSPGWELRHGGVLHVVDKDGQETAIPPDFNTLVAFDVLTDSQHFVTPVAPDAAGKARLSIGGWYHRVART